MTTTCVIPMDFTPDQAKRAAEELAGMANATRLEMLSLLVEREYTVGELVSVVGLSQSALSQHLAKLRSLGFVSYRREAQTISYRCRSAKVILILETLKQLQLEAQAISLLKFRACKVLIIEDDYSLALDIKASFERAGATVVGSVAREEDALSYIEREAPDLVIVDLNLGQGVKFGIAEHLQKRKIPLCILTGSRREDLPKVPSSLDATPWIVKPASVHTVLDIAAGTIT